MQYSISDHYLIYTIITSKTPKKKPKEILIRKYASFDAEMLISDLNGNIDIHKISVNPEHTWISWKSAFESVCERHALDLLRSGIWFMFFYGYLVWDCLQFVNDFIYE